MTLILCTLSFVGGFVFGILFGRKNKSKVEKGVARGKTEINKLKS